MTFAGDNWITTNWGAFQLQELPSPPPSHLLVGKELYPFSVKRSRSRRCMRVSTCSDRHITISEDQRVYAVVFGGMPMEAECQWLTPTMSLELDPHTGVYGGVGSWETGFMSGAVSGAPGAWQRDPTLWAYMRCCLEDVDWGLKGYDGDATRFEQGKSSSCVAGYLSGLLNVSAIMDPEIKEQSVSIRRTRPQLFALQRMFLRHGISGHISPRQDSADLVIPSTSLLALDKETHWVHSEREPVFRGLTRAKPKPFVDRILRVDAAGVQDCYTLTVGYLGRAEVSGVLARA